MAGSSCARHFQNVKIAHGAIYYNVNINKTNVRFSTVTFIKCENGCAFLR